MAALHVVNPTGVCFCAQRRFTVVYRACVRTAKGAATLQVVPRKPRENLEKLPVPPPVTLISEDIPKEPIDGFVENPKRGRGRPPKNPVEAGQPRPVAPKNSGKTTFPSPTGGAVQKKFENLITYWQGLTPNMCSRARVHVYRKWPVIDRVLSGEKNQSIHVYQEDPALGTKGSCPFTVETWKQQLLHEFGSGDYKFILNELGVSGAIAICDYVSVRDTMFPPKLNYVELVKGDKLNADYIQGLRERGIKLPGDPEYVSEKDKQEKVEMAQAEVIERLTDKLVSMADRPQPVQVAPKTLDESASAKVIDMVTKNADRMIEQATSLHTKQQDPVQMLDALSNVVSKMIPHKDGADPMVALLLEQTRLQREENAQLQREMRDREERRAEEEAQRREREEERRMKEEERRDAERKALADLAKPKTLLEQLKEQHEVNELLGIKKGKRGTDDEEEGGEKKEGIAEMILKNMPLIVSGVTTLASLGANVFYNARLPQGEAPKPVPTEPVQQVQQQVQALVSGTTPEAQTATQQQQQEFQAFMQMIEKPLLSHFFSPDLNGYSFAQYIISSDLASGPMIYMQMKAGGKEQLLMGLQSYPPIWMRIGSMTEALNTFIDEFLNYEQWKNEMDSEEDEEEKERVN